MNEKTTLEIIAPTVEEALAQGLAQLGLTADAVSVEVLDAGNRGLFGLGKPQVRVRLTVNPPVGAMEKKAEPAPAPKAEPRHVEKKAPAAPAQSKPVADVRKSAPAKEVESQPEHDALL